MVTPAVSSAVAQTHADFEVLVVNDGSSDPSTIQALRAMQGAPRVRVVHQENQGLPRGPRSWDRGDNWRLRAASGARRRIPAHLRSKSSGGPGRTAECGNRLLPS